jgi:hypothetical protein
VKKPEFLEFVHATSTLLDVEKMCKYVDEHTRTIDTARKAVIEENARRDE